jgi:hypothetical protein
VANRSGPGKLRRSIEPTVAKVIRNSALFGRMLERCYGVAVITATSIRVPDSLTELDQWVVWRYELRGDGRATKVPYQINGSRASSADPKMWCSWNDA